MSKTQERRAHQRDLLIQAAERSIAAEGLAGLKSRDLAQAIGCSTGAVYNLVEDMDELVMRVGSRTLARLDAALTAVESQGPPPARELLIRIAIAYCNFAADNTALWRALFEHRMATAKPVPAWAIEEQMALFRHIWRPLRMLLPAASDDQLSLTARSLFSAVHGMVTLGLEQKLIAVPIAALRNELAVIVGAVVDGLARSAAQEPMSSEPV
jgi:AcrR family transcriptional regulator